MVGFHRSCTELGDSAKNKKEPFFGQHTQWPGNQILRYFY